MVLYIWKIVIPRPFQLRLKQALQKHNPEIFRFCLILNLGAKITVTGIAQARNNKSVIIEMVIN